MTNYLITGCSRGLGLALATHLVSSSKEVGTVFATARHRTPALDSLISTSHGRVVFVQLDTTDEPSIAAAVTQVSRTLNSSSSSASASTPHHPHGLDVLINNAGIMPLTPDGIATMTDLDLVLHANVTSAHLVTSAFLPLLRAGTAKKVVNVSSTMGSMALTARYPFAPTPAYKVSKAALNMLTVQYALALADEGFVVVALSPGWLQTDMGMEAADLPVEVGAAAVLEKVFAAGKADTGTFLNIHVAGWEEAAGANQYDGRNAPW